MGPNTAADSHSLTTHRKAIPCDVGDHTMRWAFMGSNDYYLKVSAQGARFPTKRLRLKLDGQQWVDGTPVHGSYFEFREGAPFRFPVEVEVTSIVDEVLTDWIQSIEVRPLCSARVVGIWGPFPFTSSPRPDPINPTQT